MLPTQYVTQSKESVKAHMYILYQIVVLVQTRIHTIYTYTYYVKHERGGGVCSNKWFSWGGGNLVWWYQLRLRNAPFLGPNPRSSDSYNITIPISLGCSVIPPPSWLNTTSSKGDSGVRPRCSFAWANVPNKSSRCNCVHRDVLLLKPECDPRCSFAWILSFWPVRVVWLSNVDIWWSLGILKNRGSEKDGERKFIRPELSMRFRYACWWWDYIFPITLIPYNSQNAYDGDPQC